jgi:hypothetical protein
MVTRLKVLLFFCVLIVGCEKSDLKWNLDKVYHLAKITTVSVDNVSNTTAVIKLEIGFDGGSPISQSGVCWSTIQNPTISDNFSNNSGNNGLFTSQLLGLNPNTTYFVRAYAINAAGTSYGNQISFTTTNVSGSLATIFTSNVSSISNNNAVSGGSVTSDGGTTIIQRGVCWSSNQNPTIIDSYTNNGSALGSFTSNLSNLTANTTYYVRAYVINGIGITYGNQYDFTTTNITGSVPTINTISASSVTFSSAVSGGNITSSGGTSVIQRGVCWSINQNPTISDNFTNNGGSDGSFTSQLNNLISNTTYFVRAYAINAAGTSYGNQISFTTSQALATLVGVNDCSSLNGVTSSYRYWDGSGYSFSPWSITNNGYINSCWIAPNNQVGSYSPIGTHYIQFDKVFTNNSYITFWTKTYNPGYANITPVIYVDGIAQASPTMIAGSTSSLDFMKLQSSDISAGSHTIKIEFNCQYRTIYIDEIEFYEY